MSKHHEVVIVGGGTAGLTVAARLRNAIGSGPPDVAIVEPNDVHYYQPLWTLVGAGVFDKQVTVRPQAEFIPRGATWLRDRVVGFDPAKSALELAEGGTLTYDFLVVAAGIQLNWGAIEGLREAIGRGGVGSNYSFETVDSTWKAIREFKGGDALFTYPNTPIKCGGAPQKIMYLAEHAFRRSGVRHKSKVTYLASGAKIFGVDKYRASLERIVEQRHIETRFRKDLVALRGDAKEAVFQDLDSGERETVGYDMIHVTPPQGPPDFVAQSPLAGAGGWVEVDKYTLRHARFANVFSLGDCAGLPTAKTGASVRKQAPVMVENLLAVRAGGSPTAHYDGYASCPLITGYGTCILAEFDYDGQPCETFDFDQSQERYSMYALKAYALPQIYWHGMLRGRM